MKPPPVERIIFDWNSVERREPLSHGGYQLLDETLRDGVQCPSVVDPPVDEKIEILNLMDKLGIQWVDLGLPGSSKRTFDDVLEMVREIERSKLNIRPSCAARTHPDDIQPIIEISQQTGRPIEVLTFIGCSPIRQYTESWRMDLLLQMSAEAIEMAVDAGLTVTFVTEDSTRSRPETLKLLYRNAINYGASRLCLCDTVGHATPDGLRHLIEFTKGIIHTMGVDIGIDWHGHNDRGLALTNAISAIEAGATRVHGTCLGVGERVGNVPIDLLLLNLKLMGELDQDLTHLLDYCQTVSDAFEAPIPYNYPMAGKDAFRTATGIHASAIIKAETMGQQWLADRVYSGVPAGMFGRKQTIEVSHLSGRSNIVYWLEKRGYEASEELVEQLLSAAKASDHVMADDEIVCQINKFQGKLDS